jgi:hypothetical protein
MGHSYLLVFNEIVECIMTIVIVKFIEAIPFHFGLFGTDISINLIIVAFGLFEGRWSLVVEPAVVGWLKRQRLRLLVESFELIAVVITHQLNFRQRSPAVMELMASQLESNSRSTGSPVEGLAVITTAPFTSVSHRHHFQLRYCFAAVVVSLKLHLAEVAAAVGPAELHHRRWAVGLRHQHHHLPGPSSITSINYASFHAVTSQG